MSLGHSRTGGLLLDLLEKGWNDVKKVANSPKAMYAMLRRESKRWLLQILLVKGVKNQDENLLAGRRFYRNEEKGLVCIPTVEVLEKEAVCQMWMQLNVSTFP